MRTRSTNGPEIRQFANKNKSFLYNNFQRTKTAIVRSWSVESTGFYLFFILSKPEKIVSFVLRITLSIGILCNYRANMKVFKKFAEPLQKQRQYDRRPRNTYGLVFFYRHKLYAVVSPWFFIGGVNNELSWHLNIQSAKTQ